MFICIYVDKHVHILRKNCLLEHVIEGKIEGTIDVTGRRERRRKNLLDALIKKESEYWKLKEQKVDRTLWRTPCCKADYTANETRILLSYKKYINAQCTRKRIYFA